MDAPGEHAIRKMQAVKQAMSTALLAGAEAYANGGGRARPIVDQHFTPGNQARYDWAPLNREYFMAKARGIVKHGGAGVFIGGSARSRLDRAQRHLDAAAASKAGILRSKIDKSAQYRSGTGELSGTGTGANLPMLVLTGELRRCVASQKHPIQVSNGGELVTIKFTNLPAYAVYLEHGTGKMPQRSPVQPNAQDEAEVKAVIRRHMDAALGTQSGVPRGTALADSGARQA